MEQAEIAAITKMRNTLSFLRFLLWLGAASLFVFVIFAISGTMTLIIFFGGLVGFVIYFLPIIRMHDKIFLKSHGCGDVSLADIYRNHQKNVETYKQDVAADSVKFKNAHTVNYMNNKIETTKRKDRYNNRDILELTPELIIKYEDRSGVVTTRTLSNIRYKNSFQFNAYCHLRKEKRTFLNSSVIVATNPSGNAIDELSVKWGENGLRRTIYF